MALISSTPNLRERTAINITELLRFEYEDEAFGKCVICGVLLQTVSCTVRQHYKRFHGGISGDILSPYTSTEDFMANVAWMTRKYSIPLWKWDNLAITYQKLFTEELDIELNTELVTECLATQIDMIRTK